ncbi:hypothetical protein OG21DRAFT_1513824 [Imleria badia]|nr:hypothetical protein OG21DRAFT_1513824 [Imleria badia]
MGTPLSTLNPQTKPNSRGCSKKPKIGSARDATTSAYVDRLDSLKVISDPIIACWSEPEECPKAIPELRTCSMSTSPARGPDRGEGRAAQA